MGVEVTGDGVTAHTPDPADRDTGDTRVRFDSSFIHEAYAKVPDLGEGRRWYDLPYRALDAIRRRYWKYLPQRSRERLINWINYLIQFHSHDVNLAWSSEDPSHTLTVPEDDHVHAPGVWVVEFFPPSRIMRLSDAIEKHSWDRGRLLVGLDDGNQAMLERSRSGGSWSWWTMAQIVSPDAPYRFGNDKVEVLPPEFHAVELKAMQVGAGLTAVVAYFHVRQSAIDALDAVWHRKHEPTLVREKRRLPHALDRMWSGFRATQLQRRKVHDAARAWLAERCPGAFAAHREPQPLIDLLLLDHYDPTEDNQSSEELSNALRALGIIESGFRQISKQAPGLLFEEVNEELCPDLHGKRTYTLWGQVARVIAGLHRIEPNEVEPARSVAHALHHRMAGFFLLLSITDLLLMQRQQYGRLRDQAHEQHRRFKGRYIDQLRSTFLTFSLDITSIQRDLVSLYDRRVYGEVEFEAIYPRWLSDDGREKRVSINGDLRKRQAELCDDLVAIDKDYRDILSTVASLGASGDAYRVGRLAIWLALLSVVVSAVTLLATDVDSNSAMAKLVNWLLN
jgi:hypothetical protein